MNLHHGIIHYWVGKGDVAWLLAGRKHHCPLSYKIDAVRLGMLHLILSSWYQVVVDAHHARG